MTGGGANMSTRVIRPSSRLSPSSTTSLTISPVSAALLLVIGTTSSAPSIARLSEAEWQSYNEIGHNGPGTYAFGYDVDDPVHGNIQFRQEERHPNGTVTGSYGVLEPDGNVKVVHYVADNRGYRATIERIKKRQGGGQADDSNSDTNVVYPQYFPSMPPPVLGHSYLHVKHKPQYSNPYPPVNYPNYVYKTYPYPQPYSQSRGVSQYRL